LNAPHPSKTLAELRAERTHRIRARHTNEGEAMSSLNGPRNQLTTPSAIECCG